MSASTDQKGFQYSCKAVVYFSVSFLVNSKKNKQTTKNEGTITFLCCLDLCSGLKTITLVPSCYRYKDQVSE